MITIIVLLILAGITISMTIGQKGILQKAQEAGKNYTNATNYEHEKLSDISEEVNNIIDSLTPKPPTISEKVKGMQAGQYVVYDSGEHGVITCRVLYPVDSEYGLQIISNKNVENVTLGGSNWETGKAGYNGAIETLNNVAEKYVNPEYAYDGRCVGSIPTVENGIFVDKDKFKDSEGNIPNTVICSGKDTECYGEDTNYMIDKIALESINIWNNGQDYWLASRVLPTNSGYTDFSVRRVMNSGGLNYWLVCRALPTMPTGGVGFSNSSGFRPCISLKSYDIDIIEGYGTVGNPYVIGK